MTMYFVLILMLTAGVTDGGNALTTAHFKDKAACEAAGKEATTLASGGRAITYRCVPAV